MRPEGELLVKLMKGGFVASVAIRRSPPGQLGKGRVGSRGLDHGTWAQWGSVGLGTLLPMQDWSCHEDTPGWFEALCGMALCWWLLCPVSCAQHAMQEALWWEKHSAEERLRLKSRGAAWFSEQYLVWQLLDLCDLQDPFPKPFQLTSGP